MFLSRWPESIPKRWIPGQAAGLVTWGLVLACSIFIAVDKTGLLEAYLRGRPIYDGFGHQGNDPSARDIVDTGRHLEDADGEQDSTRLLAASNSNTSASCVDSSSSSSCSDNDSHGHQHDALMFLFNAIMLGTIMTHMTTSFRFLAGLQQTVTLFILGLTYSLVQEGLKMHTRTGIIGRSYIMWMEIDPHLILFTMLPALLTGDAMNLDTSVARRVAKQCVYLASVGVCMNGFLTAAFLSWYLQWPFLLSLTTGAILCATDPVAVVALLKELGASPTLTVLIQGESLLNDGTAIVLYTISYNMLKGENYDGAGIIIFVVKKAMCAWGLGMILGWVFLRWIALASNKLEQHNTVIQVSLTLCCSYWSFCIAEGIFGISGVLATVAAALVLAHSMWAHVVSKESMHTFWHMLEYLGNTVIFFLAGALTGKTMVHISWKDYLHLLVIYVVLIIIRALILVVSKPALKQLSEENLDVSLAEIVVMTWGGLRGAVGLALAIQVTVDRAEGAISEMEANRVLFFVGGVAALTLVVNATTCPSIVNALGVTQLPKTKLRLLVMLRSRLIEMCDEDRHPSVVTRGIKNVLDQLQNEWMTSEDEDMIFPDSMTRSGSTQSSHATPSSSSKAKAVRSTTDMFNSDSVRSMISVPAAKTHNLVAFAIGMLKHPTSNYENSRNLLESWRSALKEFKQLCTTKLKLLNYSVPGLPFVDNQDEIEQLLTNQPCAGLGGDLLRAVIEAFLAIVRSRYWHFMEVGDLQPGSFEADVLLNSVASAMGQAQHDLLDWKYVLPCIRHSVTDSDHPQSQQSCHALMDRWKASRFPESSHALETNAGKGNAMFKITESMIFNAIIMGTIILNSAFIFIEEEYRQDTNDADLSWLVIDILFTVVFTIEFVLKLAAMKHRYFFSSWNVFDFVLVLLGVMGLLVNVMSQEQGKQGMEMTAGIGRAARAFRVMRLIRLVRIVKFLQVLREKFHQDEASQELRMHLQTIGILTCFIRAHVESQQNLLLYFGGYSSNGGYKARTSEVARCILQSEVAVFRAVAMAVDVEDECDSEILQEVKKVQESKRLAEELEVFVLGAHQSGVISSGEAKSLVKPLRDHMEECQEQSSLKSLVQRKSRIVIDSRQNSVIKSNKSSVRQAADRPSEHSRLSAATTLSVPDENPDHVSHHIENLSPIVLPHCSDVADTTSDSLVAKSTLHQPVDTDGAENHVVPIASLVLYNSADEKG